MPAKIGKSYAWLIGVALLGGMVLAFVLHHSAKPVEDSGSRKKAIAAQVGNDLPVSEMSAKEEIERDDAMVKQMLRKEASQPKPERDAWPNMQLPFQTGRVSAHDIQVYREAKEALAEKVQKPDTHAGIATVQVPEPFDASGSAGQQASSRLSVPDASAKSSGDTKGDQAKTDSDVGEVNLASESVNDNAKSQSSLLSDMPGGADPNLKMMAQLVGKQTRALTDPNADWQSDQAKAVATRIKLPSRAR